MANDEVNKVMSPRATSREISAKICAVHGHSIGEERIIGETTREPMCHKCGLKLSEIRDGIETRPA